LSERLQSISKSYTFPAVPKQKNCNFWKYFASVHPIMVAKQAAFAGRKQPHFAVHTSTHLLRLWHYDWVSACKAFPKVTGFLSCPSRRTVTFGNTLQVFTQSW
jgi:hypothetical protein